MKTKYFTAACMATLAASAAMAAGDTYGEIGIVPMDISAAGASLTPTVVMARLGLDFSKHFSAEVTAATSVRSAHSNGEWLKVSDALGAYLKARTEFAPRCEAFAKLGWARTSLSNSLGNSASDSDLSYAAGIQFMFSRKVYGQVDYANYYNKDGLRIAGPSASVGIRF